MKKKPSRKKQQGIAERKTAVNRRKDIPYRSIGLGTLLWLSIVWIFFGWSTSPAITSSEGDLVREQVKALVEFTCIDTDTTELAKQEAANQVPPIFTLEMQPKQDAVQEIQTLFSELEKHAEAVETERPDILASINDFFLRVGCDLDPRSFSLAFPSNAVASVRSQLIASISQVMDEGILADDNRQELAYQSFDRQLTIKHKDSDERQTFPMNEINSRREAVWAMTQSFTDSIQRSMLNRLLFSLVRNNLTYDETATEESRQQRSNAIPTTMKTYQVGDVIVDEDDRVTEQMEEALKAHADELDRQRDPGEEAAVLFGNSILLLVGLIATAIMLRIFNSGFIRKLDKVLLMLILSLFTLLVARLLSYLALEHSLLPSSAIMYLVPHALAVLLAGILLGGSAAICLGFWTSFATAVLLDNSFIAFGLGILVTITATCTARNIHRRASLFRAGLWVCVVMMLYAAVIAVMEHQLLSGLATNLAAAIISGVLSTVLTLLLIPAFEKLFKITTDITLLELSDMGHPLLQKMAMQAPGTYHHSLMVATLAQNAAEAIGANSLLVRVCAYYHDIGKMAKPEFFTENIQHKENPHDELSPHMSALVISSHVKEGLALAKRHKLPQPILDAIEQHHGNGLISFFYHKAKQQVGDGTTTMTDLINESDFRYGGAPAVTKEMAILSLADASEAASRSIEKPTPQKISNLLDEIFAMKIRDGQMDFANLTMAEIKVVKQSFVFSLSNMLHGRIPYPKDHENKSPKPTENTSGPGTENKKAG